MRKITLLIISALMIASPLHAEDYYDPQHTMLALNMAVVSVHRILAAKNRVILDQEYQNIINNLNLGSIRSDPEILALYEKLLDITSRKKLRAQEVDHIKKDYNERARHSISSAFTDLGKTSAAMLREDGSIGAFFGSFSTLVSVSAASYFKYRAGGETLSGSLDSNLYRLNAEDEADLNDMQKQLLTSSWNLLNKYHLSDEYRLVQRALDDFYKALETQDSSRRLRMLQALENDFRAYPPYWFYRAKAAQDSNYPDEAAKCFDKFDEVWRPVLRQDPYVLEASKYRISQLVKDGLPTDEYNRTTLELLCSAMRQNTLRDDWVNNIFAGAVYYALGKKDEGIKCVEVNIDFGFEHELSSAVLENMRLNVPPGLLLSEALRLLKLNEITSGMTSQDRQKVFMIADCLDDKDGAAERLSVYSHGPASMHVVRVSLLRKGESSTFGEIVQLAEMQPVSGDELSRDYAVIMPLLRVYLEDESPGAYALLGDMHLYGWNVSRDSELAMSYYHKAAEMGDVYSQVMYTSMLLAERCNVDEDNMPVSEPNVQTEEKPKPKKPLLRFWPFKR